MGCIGSILSIGCVGSVLSIASSGSTLSVLSTNCNYKFFTDCRNRPDSTTNVQLAFSANAWQNMKACNYTGYRAEPRMTECNYQQVQVTIATATGQIEQTCKARRKGTATWQDIDQKPSFKVKCEDDMELGEHNCTGVEKCPGGGVSNTWKSKKFLLNNGGFSLNGLGTRNWHSAEFYLRVLNTYYTWGEVDFYVMLRKIGGNAWPFAKWADVQVFNNGSLINSDQYVFLENADDKEFGKKWFGVTGWALWEFEFDKFKLQRDYGNFECTENNGGSCVVDNLFTLPATSGFSFSNLSRTAEGTDAMVSYYVAEKLGAHWDGVCLRNSIQNLYLAVNNSGWYIVPHGADATYQGCVTEMKIGNPPECGFMKECFESDACVNRFHTIHAKARQNAHRTTLSCREEVTLPVVYFALGIGLPLLFVLGLLQLGPWLQPSVAIARNVSGPSLVYTRLKTRKQNDVFNL